MFHRQKAILVQCVCLALSMGLVGCDRSGDGTQTPAAAINGEVASPESSGGQSDSSGKPDSDPKHPVVVIETSLGNITVQLDGKKTPGTVANFLTYVDDGHYDRTIIHQVFKGQGFLAGGYGTNLVERPSRTPIRNEAHYGEKNRRGTVAMARRPDDIDSATCQFFVNVADNPALDFKDQTPDGCGYCVFGQIIEGMDVVDKINNAEVSDTSDFERTPTPPIVVESIRRVR